MSSEMRECPFCGNSAWVVRVPDTRRFRPQCKKCGADLGEFDREADAVAAWNRRALLARTEAGADRPVAEISELSGAKLIVLYSADEIGHLPKGTKLYTHPQDARGDAVTGRVNGYMFSARAIEIITDGEVPEWITKTPGLRVTITAMQAKEPAE